MNLFKKLVCLGALAAASVATAAPVLDGGWAIDTISGADTPSTASPYVYNLTDAALFTITDDFVVTDTYKVYDGATLILTTSVTPGGNPFGGAGGPAYSWGSVLLSAGSHSLTITGDGVGGLPAGFYARLDSVPDSGSLLPLVSALVAGLMVYARRQKLA